MSNGGKVAFSTVSAANPKIKWAGIAAVYGGTFNVGNSAGDPIPSDSVADLAMASAANVDSGLVFNNGATVNLYGYAKPSTQCKLSADFGGYAISDNAGTWVSLVQGGGNASASGSGSWDTGAGFANGGAVTFTSVTTAGTTFAKTIAASSAIRNWASASISAGSNAASCSLTYSGSPALTAGMWVFISGFTGNWLPLNGWQKVASLPDSTHFIPGATVYNSTAWGAVTGTPVFSGSALNITVALTGNTSFGWLPGSNLNLLTLTNLDGTTPDLSSWAASDQLGVAPTGKLNGECEEPSVSSANNSTKVVTLSGNLSYPHTSMAEVGIVNVACEVSNLTRNVRIHGASASLQGYIVIAATAVVTGRYAELYWLGSNTASKRGVDVQTTTGTFDWQYGALHDFAVTGSRGVNCSGSSGQSTSTLIFSNNVTYAVDDAHLTFAATSGTWTASGNVFIKNVTAGAANVNLLDVGGTFTNNAIAGNSGSGGFALSLGESNALGTFSGNVCHCGPTHLFGAVNGSLLNSTILNCVSWRGGSSLLYIAAARNLTVSGFTGFSSGSASGCLLQGANNGLLFTGCTVNSDPVFPCAFAASLNTSPSQSGGIVAVESCDFGTQRDLRTSLTGSDISVNGSGYAQYTVVSTKLASINQVGFVNPVVTGSFILAQRLGGTAGNHKFWTPYGSGVPDTVIYNNASPSVRLTPNNASNKLEFAPPGGYGVLAAVASGGTLMVKVYVRKSKSTDASGANYNGSQPRLILRRNVALGISADTVLATVGDVNNADPGLGVWGLLTGTTAVATDDGVHECVVDCDGTAGWINVDDWALTPTLDTKGTKYWFGGLPNVVGDNGGGCSRGRQLIG